MNPRAALTTYSLSRGAPSASLGTSPNCPTQSLWFISLPEAFYIISRCFSFVKNFFDFFQNLFLFLTSGESGIRTHAPLRTNGFQDRLVMTTSISLRIHFSVFFALLCQRKTYSIIELRTCQHLNLHFFIFFQKSFCNIKIFWCCDLDILVGAFYQADLGAFFLLYYHGIIGDS